MGGFLLCLFAALCFVGYLLYANGKPQQQALPQGPVLLSPPDASGAWADFFSDRALARLRLVPLGDVKP